MSLESDKNERRGKVWSHMARGLSEVFGTGLLLLFGCMGGLPGFGSSPPPALQAALVFGITVSSIVQIFGHVSGAHLNPAVTAAAWVMGLVDITTAGIYVASQFIGATLGYSLLLVITPTTAFYPGQLVTNETHAFCTTVPGVNVGVTSALLGEYVATCVLILLCCGVWDKRNSLKQDGVPIKFGLTIAALALAEGPYSGCSMNPARTFGPSLLTGVWSGHWIYWVGPMAAGITMAYMYKLVFDRELDGPTETDPSEIPLNQKFLTEKESLENIPTV